MRPQHPGNALGTSDTFPAHGVAQEGPPWMFWLGRLKTVEGGCSSTQPREWFILGLMGGTARQASGHHLYTQVSRG